MENDGLMSQTQAARILGVKRQRVGQLIAEGKLTPVPLAGRNVLMTAQVLVLKARRELAHAGKEP